MNVQCVGWTQPYSASVLIEPTDGNIVLKDAQGRTISSDIAMVPRVKATINIPLKQAFFTSSHLNRVLDYRFLGDNAPAPSTLVGTMIPVMVHKAITLGDTAGDLEEPLIVEITGATDERQKDKSLDDAKAKAKKSKATKNKQGLQSGIEEVTNEEWIQEMLSGEEDGILVQILSQLPSVALSYKGFKPNEKNPNQKVAYKIECRDDELVDDLYGEALSYGHSFKPKEVPRGDKIGRLDFMYNLMTTVRPRAPMLAAPRSAPLPSRWKDECLPTEVVLFATIRKPWAGGNGPGRKFRVGTQAIDRLFGDFVRVEASPR